MAVVWDVASCSLVDNDRRFRESYCLYHHPDDGVSKLLWGAAPCSLVDIDRRFRGAYILHHDLWRKGPPVPNGLEAGWASEPVLTQRLEEKSFAPTRNRTPQSVIILTELPRLSRIERRNMKIESASILNLSIQENICRPT
jgi:hypothetical protein